MNKRVRKHPGEVVDLLYFVSGNALVDLLVQPNETPPLANSRVLCRHPFQVRGIHTLIKFVRNP